MVILIIAAFFTLIPYGYNWFVTGTPFFPASFGPFASPFYDKIAGQLARDWHYHLSLPDAIKNVSTFMVWPGILSSKILFPLALLSSLLAFLSDKKEERLFTTGMTFFVMSVIIVILTETYVVFEMRYYRYGIGIYALACTFLIGFLLRTFLQQTFLKKFEKWITLGLVLLICAYCLHYSFNNMGNSRPQAKDIIAFLTGKETETHIIAKRYQIADQLYTELKNINPDPRHTGFLLSFSWPHTFYPIAGKNIAYINAGGFDTTVYFNEGLFAQALLKNDITFILNQLALDNNYPLPGGAAYNVFQQCGKPVSTTHSTFITLSDSCLKTVAAQHNLENAKERLNKALATIKTLPNYEPFNYPQYGGPSNIIK